MIILIEFSLMIMLLLLCYSGANQIARMTSFGSGLTYRINHCPEYKKYTNSSTNANIIMGLSGKVVSVGISDPTETNFGFYDESYVYYSSNHGSIGGINLNLIQKIAKKGNFSLKYVVLPNSTTANQQSTTNYMTFSTKVVDIVIPTIHSDTVSAYY